MKKLIAIALALCLMMATFAACDSGSGDTAPESEAGESTPAEESNEPGDESEDESEGTPDGAEDGGALADVLDSGKLIVATEAGFPPMEYYEGSEIVGIDVDIVKAIAEGLGVEVEFLELEFNSIIPAITSGKAHLAAAGMTVDEERAQSVDFTVNYFKSTQVVLTQEGSDITDEDDLEGKTIGVQLGTVGDYYATDDVDCTVKQFEKYMQAIEELKNGSIDCIIIDIIPAQFYMQNNEGLAIAVELFDEDMAMAVNKGEAELLNKVNEIIQGLLDDGSIDTFTENHMG